MNIQSIPISQLQPAPYNPRLTLNPGDKAWQKLERSLTEFELVQPIVWNRLTGHIVSGHQRLAVLKHHGAEVVACVVVELSLEKEKALNVTLNNNSVGSDWDAEKLVDLVNELQALPDFDATLTGFDEQQLRDLVLAPAWNDGGVNNTDSPDDGLMQVVLQVPVVDWESLRDALDQIISRFPAVRLHVSESQHD